MGGMVTSMHLCWYKSGYIRKRRPMKQKEIMNAKMVVKL